MLKRNNFSTFWKNCKKYSVYCLISICHKGDIVVSQDYGVAAMVLGKGAYAIHQSGKWYTNDNIDRMLMERHLNKKARRASGKNHIKGYTMSSGHRFCADRSGSGDPKKRTSEDDKHPICRLLHRYHIFGNVTGWGRTPSVCGFLVAKAITN